MITNANSGSGTDVCRFCGQQVMLPDGHEGEAAERFCNCTQAKRMRWRDERLHAIADMIQDGILGDGHSTPAGDVALSDDTAQLLEVAAVMIIDGKLDELQLRIGDQKVHIRRGRDEKLVLQRTVRPQTTVTTE